MTRLCLDLEATSIEELECPVPIEENIASIRQLIIDAMPDSDTGICLPFGGQTWASKENPLELQIFSFMLHNDTDIHNAESILKNVAEWIVPKECEEFIKWIKPVAKNEDVFKAVQAEFRAGLPFDVFDDFVGRNKGLCFDLWAKHTFRGKDDCIILIDDMVEDTMLKVGDLWIATMDIKNLSSRRLEIW